MAMTARVVLDVQSMLALTATVSTRPMGLSTPWNGHLMGSTFGPGRTELHPPLLLAALLIHQAGAIQLQAFQVARAAMSTLSLRTRTSSLIPRFAVRHHPCLKLFRLWRANKILLQVFGQAMFGPLLPRAQPLRPHVKITSKTIPQLSRMRSGPSTP